MNRWLLFSGILGLCLSSSCVKQGLAGCWIGAFIEDVPSAKDIDRFQEDYGKRPALVSIFLDWGRYPEERVVHDVYGRDGTLMVTWEPWTAATQKGIDYDALLAGSEDAYIRTFALKMKAIEKPVFLRFAHEMNGDWYPWSGQKIGGEKYQRLFRHVRKVFESVGADKVRWVFSINAENVPPANAYEACYPGDRYVDYVGLDGYNWGSTRSWGRWRSFQDVFSGPYEEVLKKFRKPVLIAEFGSASSGGDKAEWIREALESMRTMPELKGFVLFNKDKEADWRFSQDAPAGKALYEGLKSPYFWDRIDGGLS